MDTRMPEQQRPEVAQDRPTRARRQRLVSQQEWREELRVEGAEVDDG